MTITSTVRTYLAGYILDLFRDWSAMRQTREIDWQAALDAFSRDNSQYWETRDDDEDWRDATFVGIIRTKTIAAMAIVLDVVLQGGQIPFALKPSQEELPPEMQQLAAMGLPVPTPEDEAQALEAMAKAIQQQFAAAKADRQLIKIVLSMALYGEGYLKAPVVQYQRKSGFRMSIDPMTLTPSWQRYQESIPIPAGEYVSVWDVFRDYEVTDIQKGIGIIHRAMISPFELRAKIGAPHFMEEAIEAVIAGNLAHQSLSDVSTLPPHLRDIVNRKRNIAYLEFWGRVPLEYLDDFRGSEVVDPTLDGASGHEVEIHCCLANDEVVRIVGNPEGRRPYHRAVWEEDLDNLHGQGVADNLQDTQFALNNAVRTFIDNKKLSGNAMFGGRSSALASGVSNKMAPGKWFECAEDVDDVRKAIQQFVVQDVGEGLLSLIAILERYADEESGLPKVMQGDVAEKKKPDTLGEMNILVSQAGKYLGQVIRNLDEGIIEPWVEWIYEWNMLQGEGPQGDFQVNATGFSSFQNRVVRGQSLQTLLTLALSSPALFQEVKIRALLEEICKALDVDPDQFLLTEQEKMEQMIQGQMVQLQAMARMASEGQGAEASQAGASA